VCVSYALSESLRATTAKSEPVFCIILDFRIEQLAHFSDFTHQVPRGDIRPRLAVSFRIPSCTRRHAWLAVAIESMMTDTLAPYCTMPRYISI
jgi:hypothetical protein